MSFTLLILKYNFKKIKISKNIKIKADILLNLSLQNSTAQPRKRLYSRLKYAKNVGVNSLLYPFSLSWSDIQMSKMVNVGALTK